MTAALALLSLPARAVGPISGTSPLAPPLGSCQGGPCPNPFPQINNGDFAGRDSALNIFAGGNFQALGRSAELEGRAAVLGNFTVSKNPTGLFNLGVAGVGSRVVPPDGSDYLVAGGNVTVTGGNTLEVGGVDSTSVAWGNIRAAGAVSGVIDYTPPGTTIHDPNAAAPYAPLRPYIQDRSACAAQAPATGTVEVSGPIITFHGDGTSALQVFNLPGNIGTATSVADFSFTGIPPGATVLVNMTGTNPIINTNTGTFLPNDPMYLLGPKLMWNFPNASTALLTGGAQFWGSMMTGLPTSVLTVNTPGTGGRIYAAGDLTMNSSSAGSELHAYPFDGLLPECAAVASLSLRKIVTPTTVTAAGQTVQYSFAVTNTGGTTLTALRVADTAFSGTGAAPVISCPVTTLAPSAVTTCTASYTVTQADIDAGRITNTAVATGTPPSGPAVDSPPSSATVTATAAPALAIAKSATPPTVNTAGNTIGYSFTVTNTGNVTLTGVHVTDTMTAPAGPNPTVTCPVTTLAPGGSMACTATYTLTQADVDHGRVDNSATATGTPPTGPAVTSPPSTAEVPIPPSLAILVVKSATPSAVHKAGDVISYSFVVTNNGNTTLTHVTVADVMTAPAGPNPDVSCPVATLAPGASTTCTATYTVTQADADHGRVDNSATATGNPPSGPAVTSPPSTADVPIRSAPALTLVKTANPTTVSGAGQIVGYSFAVTNTGTVTVTSLEIADTAFSGTGTVPTAFCPVTTLAPGASTICTATYVTTQADIDAGQITNTAVARATPPNGGTVDSPPSSATVTATHTLAVTVAKSATPSTVSDAGNVITYEFVVTNSGNSTLTNITVTDTMTAPAGPNPTVSCPVTTLAPGASTTCTAIYTVTQADVDHGRVDNSATVTGTPPTGPPITSPPSTAEVPIPASPALNLLKTADPATVAKVGDTVGYTFEVKNTGNVTLTALKVADTAFSGSGTAPTVSCPVTVLAPGAATICTASYPVTQADLDAGQITNTAVATGTPPTGPAVDSPPSSATVVATQNATLRLVKSATPATVSHAADVISYSFEVTNTGNSTLTDVNVTDTMTAPAGPAPTVSCPVTTLAPGASTTCTATYPVKQADIDAGRVVDSATAHGTPPTGPAVDSNLSSVTVPAEPVPALRLVKTASPTSVTAPGQTVTYSFLVLNTGNVTLTSVHVAENAFSGTGTPSAIACRATTLAPTASTTCTATYVTTQADIDAGQITNTATATGTPPSGPAVDSAPSSATVTATHTLSLAVVKSAQSGASHAGDVISYSFAVSNNGNTTLTNIHVTDTMTAPAGPNPTVSCPATTLAPGASTTCTASYTVTQADVDHGQVANSAIVTGTPPSGPAVTSPPSTADVPIPRTATLTLVKTAAPTTVTAAGQTVRYSFTVTNTGNVTLTALTVTDTAFSGSGTAPTVTCSETTLAPGVSTTCTATYVVTQTDINAGQITNTATATGTPPSGPAVTSPPSSATVTAQATTALALEKRVNPSTVTEAGQTVEYLFDVTNTGNVTLTSLQLTDTTFSGTGTLSVITCPVTSLAPGASTTCSASYVTTQADIDAGRITNTATATGTPPSGPAVTSPPASATVTAPPAPKLTLAKEALPPTTDAAGHVIDYKFEVENTGNVTLTNLVVTDTMTAPAGPNPTVSCPVTTLAPGASTTCSASYTVTQADADHGRVDNSATATGIPPSGPAVTSPPSTAEVLIPSSATLTLVKTADPASVTAAGQTVRYAFAVTNTGNVTLTSVHVADGEFSGTGTPPAVTCPVPTLAPGASTTCTATYTVTQADVDAGQITNTATATGTPPSGPAVDSPPSSATVVITHTLSLTVAKSATPATVSHAGDVISYRFLVTNNGNTTLTGITVTDTMTAPAGPSPTITCPARTLAPGAATTCTASYVVTQADVDHGRVDNSATVTGTPPTGPSVTSPPSTAEVPIPASATVTLVKTASPSTVTAVGETVHYSFEVTNTGNVTLTALHVADTAFSGSGTAPSVSCPVTTLAPGAATTCAASYAITQTDIDNGHVTNTAVATGTPPSGPAVDSAPSTATVTAEHALSLIVVKSATPATVHKAGDVISYSFEVTNGSNVPMRSIHVTDTMTAPAGPSPTVSCPVTTLAAGASTTCTATYTVTQADVDHGRVDNAATVTGTPPSGPAITSPPSPVEVPIPSSAHVTLVKTASPTTVTAAGQTVDYSFAVTNTGNVTLRSLVVADSAFSGTGTPPAITCPVTTLAPGATTTCTAAYATTQADIDAGQITNTATVAGTPPTGPAVTSAPSSATVIATHTLSLTVAKSAKPATVHQAGDLITYTFEVVNGGNATLTNIHVTDDLTAPAGPNPTVACPVTTLAPGASTTCTATYTVTQADVDHGRVDNAATVTGTPPSGPAITSPPSTAEVPIPASAAVTLVKTATPTTVTEPGQTVSYSFAVTNTGNVTLKSLVVADTAFSGTGTAPAVSCPVATLAPGASTTCTASYEVTRADIDAGQITNTATATGTPPTGPAVAGPPSSATVTAARTLSLTVTKSVSPTEVHKAGDVISYSFEVVNNGNVTMTDIRVTDTMAAPAGPNPTVSCPVTTLAAGASTTCTATYTVSQTDVDHGKVGNSATVTGTPPSGPPVTSPPSTAEVPIPAVPAVGLVKAASPTTVAAAGQTVDYSFAVTNTGNVTLTSLQVADTAFSGTGTAPVISCPVTTLAPGASTTCTATYTVTQADLDAGQITNTATATGTPPGGSEVTSPPSSATVTVTHILSIAVVKSATPGTVHQAGDVISYSFAVTNSGNATLTNIHVTDTLTPPAGPNPTVACPVTTLAPGASTTCTATYTVTQADVDHGKVGNSATATGTPPSGPEVTSPPSSVEVPIPAAATLTLVKTATPTTVTAVGQTVDYRFLVTNTGNVTVSGLAVHDALAAPVGTAVAVTCPVTSLAPGASTTCTATYTVTQADVDRGTVDNVATASGKAPEGSGVTSPEAEAHVAVPGAPSMTAVKKANTTAASVGQKVRYSVVVTNTGNVTLTGVAVTDGLEAPAGPGPAVTCPVTTLAPGASTTCVSAPYTVTEADLRAGSVADQAVVTAHQPSGAGGTVEVRSNRVTVPVRAMLPGTGAGDLFGEASTAAAAVVLGLALLALSGRRRATRRS